MANFERAEGAGGAGFDDSKYLLTMPLDNRRAVWLNGGGPKGEKLVVEASNPNLRLVERTSARKGGAIKPGIREFWVDGIVVGDSSLTAKVPGGGDYSKPLPVKVTASKDVEVIKSAFTASRLALRTTVHALEDLRKALLVSQSNPPSTRIFTHSDALTDMQKRVMTCVSKWLNVPDYNRRLGPTEYKAWVTQVAVVLGTAMSLMNKNIGLSATVFVRVPEGFHAAVWGDAALGVEAGESFFSHDGPNCRRDVLTHEFFHLLGVGHGIDPLGDATIHRFGITPDQSLNSADNLAQLTCDINTSRFDCCTRKDD